MTRRYFEKEMRYLHEAGKLFAEAHPEQARYLNIESLTDRDPYVERLFEGFAFLAGRIHERLDDDLPEYAEQLLQLVEPAALKPVPSLTLLAFRPAGIQSTIVLPRGTEVKSKSTGKERVVCRFQTTRAVPVRPLRLEEVALQWAPDGTSSATLDLRVFGSEPLSELQLSPLRLYFHAEPGLTALMYLYFTRYATRVTVKARGSLSLLTGAEDDARTVELPPDALQPGGFGKDEWLLPDVSSFSGFRLLQEYLSFRHKFWCVDLVGLDRIPVESGADRLRVTVHFDRSYPEQKPFDAKHIQLHCTPAINLFEHDSEPIRARHETAEYRIVPGRRGGQAVEVYDVQRVVGTNSRTGKRREYASFFGLRGPGSRAIPRYSTARRIGPKDRPEVFLRLNTQDVGDGLQEETISLDLRCTNGTFPRERLREHTITELGPDVPDGIEVTNLTAPSLIIRPPVDRHANLVWEFVAHRALNYRTVAERETLVGLLEFYDWTDDGVQRRLRSGIREVRWEPKEVLHRGAVLRGTEVTVELMEDHAPNEGEAALLGLVLSRFLSMYATMNAFVHLTLTLIPSGKQFQWTPEAGYRPML